MFWNKSKRRFLAINLFALFFPLCLLAQQTPPGAQPETPIEKSPEMLPEQPSEKSPEPTTKDSVEPSPATPVVTAPSLPVIEWTPKFTWSGDLRYRGAKSKEDIDEERNFQQLRARLGLRADVERDLSVQLRLATGSSAISTNQTLGDPKDPVMARRSFGLDLAFVDWSFAESGRIWAGRTANAFWAPGKSQIIYDSDLAFEGVSLKWFPQWSSSKMFFNIGAFIISENYDSTARQDVVDTGLIGAEIGYSEKTSWGTGTLHFALHEYLNVQDKNIVNVDKDAKTDVYSIPYDRFRGNAVYRPDMAVANYFYQNQFALREWGVQWDFKFEFFQATVYYDSVENTKVDDQNRASEYGVSLSSGRMQISYAWIEKQSESVLGAFSDSDANGGGTDNKGTRLSLGYQLSKNSQLAFSQYQAKRGMATVERDFTLTQFDVLVSF